MHLRYTAPLISCSFFQVGQERRDEPEDGWQALSWVERVQASEGGGAGTGRFRNRCFRLAGSGVLWRLLTRPGRETRRRSLVEL